MFSFTHLCAGDLGIVVGDSVVAILFIRDTDDHPDSLGHLFSVYDIFKGGDGRLFGRLDQALAEMFTIAGSHQ